MDFNGLMYTMGGGVIGAQAMEDQTNKCMLAIGLGGTGKEALKALKRGIYEHVKPDNPDESVPKYKRYSFLCIDTDDAKLSDENQQVNLSKTEDFFPITGNPNDLINKATQTLISGRSDLKWLDVQGAKLSGTGAGAGGVRQIGRYFLFQRANDFVNEVTNRLKFISKTVEGVTPAECDIYIFTGLGGGTGSGTFLDVCYLIRYALAHANITIPCGINGFFLLPDVNFTYINDLETKKYIEYNSYAVMKELDYCMSFGQNGGKWSQEYYGLAEKVETDEQPVDICYLVSASDVSGGSSKDAIRECSDYIQQFCANNAINMSSIINNFSNIEGNLVKTVGANHFYKMIGASQTVLPLREIYTYLSAYFFHKLQATADNSPSDQDIKDWANSLGYTVEAFIKKTGTIALPEMDVEELLPDLPDTLTTDNNGDKYNYSFVLESQLLEPYHNKEETDRGNIARIVEAMGNKLPDDIAVRAAMDNNNDSLICRAYVDLSAKIADPAYGPVWCATALKGATRENLCAILRGCVEELKTMIRNDNSDIIVKQVKAARDEYNNVSGLNKKKKRTEALESLIGCLNQLFKQRAKINRLVAIKNALESVVIPRMEEMYKAIFGRFEEIMRTLFDVMDKNLIALRDLKADKKDPYLVNLVDIEKIREILDRHVDSYKLNDLVDNFYKAFYKEEKVWRYGTDGDIVFFMRDYLTALFKPYAGRAIDDFYTDKYWEETRGNAAELQKKIQDELETISANAAYLFMPRRLIADSAFNTGAAYLIYPANCPQVEAAVLGWTPVMHNVVEAHPGGTDRLFFVRGGCGIPLCAYEPLLPNFASYNAATNKGMHLYTGTPNDSRNWRNLDNLRPFSAFHTYSDWQTEAALGRVRDYEDAIKVGIIHAEMENKGGKLEESEKWNIWCTVDITKISEDVKSVLEKGSVEPDTLSEEELLDLLNELKRTQEKLASFRKENELDYQVHYQYNDLLQANVPVSVYYSIPNDSHASDDATKAKYRKDFVLASQAWMAVIREELGKKKALEDLGSQLEKKVSEIDGKYQSVYDDRNEQEMMKKLRESKMELFLKLLYVGAIKNPTPIKFSLTYKPNPILDPEEVVLSAPGTGEYSSSYPLYQAFLGFMGLGEEVWMRAEEELNEIMNSDDLLDIVKTASEPVISYYKKASFMKQNDAAKAGLAEAALIYSLVVKNALDFRMVCGLID